MIEQNEIVQEQKVTEDAEDEITNDVNETFENDGTQRVELQDAPPNPVKANAVTERTLAHSLPQKTARDDEPYDFERCSVLVMLQLMPLREGQTPNERKVFVSARTHSYPPHLNHLRWDELAPRLPNEINALLDSIKAELPRREAERQALAEAERLRQAQLKAESEKRRAGKKDKTNSANPTTAKQASQKRNKRVDLNALPTLEEGNSAQKPVTEIVTTEQQEPVKTEPSAQMTMF